jgi:hypothetical protein
VSALLTFIAQLANLNLTLPGTTPLAQVVPCFVIKPGESPLDALNRLVALYELSWQFRADSTLLITDAQPADPVSWAYGPEALGVGYGAPVDQPNVIRVIGDSSAAWSEVQDDLQILAAGVIVPRLIVDRLISTAAAAKIRAQQALRQEQILAAHAQLTLTINPQLELADVLSVTDSRVGLAATHLRINSIDTVVDWQSGAWAQHVDLTNA